MYKMPKWTKTSLNCIFPSYILTVSWPFWLYSVFVQWILGMNKGRTLLKKDTVKNKSMMVQYIVLVFHVLMKSLKPDRGVLESFTHWSYNSFFHKCWHRLVLIFYVQSSGLGIISQIIVFNTFVASWPHVSEINSNEA